MAKGKLIVLEGTDGSGKGEQTKLLLKHLKDSGYEIVTFDFPRHGEQSAWFVDEYLRGNFGTIEEVGPKVASMFYALDRYVVAPQIRSALEQGKIVVSNRYVGSNLAHQGSKLMDRKEREEYFQWNYDLEYVIDGLPKPDLNIILHVPAEIAQKLVDNKPGREYLGGKKRDIHESNLDYLKHTEKVYRELSLLFPKDFVIVECVENARLLSLEEVHEKIWKIIEKII